MNKFYLTILIILVVIILASAFFTNRLIDVYQPENIKEQHVGATTSKVTEPKFVPEQDVPEKDSIEIERIEQDNSGEVIYEKKIESPVLVY